MYLPSFHVEPQPKATLEKAAEMIVHCSGPLGTDQLPVNLSILWQ